MKTSYGKAQVGVYRTYVRPLEGLAAIPESSFAGRSNELFAMEVDVEVFGDNFLAAYTEGDNSNVVATDTMKNFILREALDFDGATAEQFLWFLGQRFLATYPTMGSLRLTGRQVPFEPASVPATGGFGASHVLFGQQRGDEAIFALDVGRDATGLAHLTNLSSGRVGLQLIKLTGSSFASFQRDSYTTLPQVIDRPLFIYLDAHWRYIDPLAAMAIPSYVPSEQVRDLAATVFHEFVSKSIQHLAHEIGQRMLLRWPQLSEVSFDAQNRLWDTAHVSEADPKIKVYYDPRPPYGHITFTLARS